MSRLLENSEENRNYYLNLNKSININDDFDVEKYRKSLLNRNIYTPNNEYDINNPKLLKSVSSLINVIEPINKITNTIQNLYDRIVNPTPIVKIGMNKLSQQLLLNVASRTSAKISEVVDLGNIFKKNTPIYSGLSYKITKDNTKFNVGTLVKDLVGYTQIKSPFNENSTIIDYIENTGKGQLNQLVTNLNKNNYIINDFFIKKLTNDKHITQLQKKDYRTNLYFVDDNNLIINNSILGNSYYNQYKVNENNEYGIIKDYGKTILNVRTQEINSDDYGHDSNIDNQIVWGRDDRKSKENLVKNGSTNENGNLIEYNESKLTNSFNVKDGILRYTNALINATENKIIDITRKKILNPSNNNEFVGFNGAGIYDVPDDAKSINPNLYDGVRQHTFLDQYDRNVKLIRFNGNKMYSGNENTTNYRTVSPKIHPEYDNEGNVNNRNMMFSIENLAIQVKKDIENGVAFMNDEYSTVLPLSEAGLFGGRIMWFPPYSLELREDVSSQYTNTNFIGRSEPVYTYDYTERSASLSFKLLMDHPPQLKGFKDSSQAHKEISEFFLFGGDKKPIFDDLTKLRLELDKINQRINDLNDTVLEFDLEFPDDTISYFFDNDSDEFSEIYENGNLLTQPINYGLNVERITSMEGDVPPSSQFINRLNDKLNQYLIDDYRGLINIKLDGFATTLYMGGDKDRIVGKYNGNPVTGLELYNYRLSERRIKTIENLIKTIKPEIDFDVDFKIKPLVVGSTKSIVENDPNLINTLDAKSERRVDITFTRNSESKNINITLSEEEQRELIELYNVKGDLERKIANITQQIHLYDTNTFNKIEVSDKFLRGYQGVKENKFQPIFYSQTPEDYHRRLTFLQQCMRQGGSIDNQNSNSVFGRMPICVLRIGDFFYTKIIIESMSIDYSTENIWDLNPEGMGVQPMIAEISLRIKVIGGQSLERPIQILQNALTFNYYANSTFYDKGLYSTPKYNELLQKSIDNNVESQDLINMRNEIERRKQIRDNL